MNECASNMPYINHQECLQLHFDGSMVLVDHVQEVEDVISKVQMIREAISDLATIEDKALMQSFGLAAPPTHSEEDNSAQSAGESAEEDSPGPAQEIQLTQNMLRRSYSLSPQCINSTWCGEYLCQLPCCTL